MASIFKKARGKPARIPLTIGPGALSIFLAIILGKKEDRMTKFNIRYKRSGETTTHEVFIGCVHPVSEKEYEIWGDIYEVAGNVKLREAFHGMYNMEGRGDAIGWIEAYEDWLMRDGILCCPNVFDLPGIEVLGRYHEAGEKVKPEQCIGWGKKLSTDTPPTKYPKRKKYDLFQIFNVSGQDGPRLVVAFPRREVTYDPTDYCAFAIDDDPHVIVL